MRGRPATNALTDRAVAWQDRAACAKVPFGTMFPTDGAGVVHAKAICAVCPVTAECLRYALANRIDDGVWGGASERERRAILRQRKAAS